MTSIYSYQKFITKEITRTLNTFSLGLGAEAVITELATIDGLTYVSVPDGVDIPAGQPAEIADSIAEVIVTDELRAAIMAASPHVRLIGQRVVEKIREAYSVDYELFLTRIALGAASNMYVLKPGEKEELLAFGLHAEACRTWGREQRAVLGL